MTSHRSNKDNNRQRQPVLPDVVNTPPTGDWCRAMKPDETPCPLPLSDTFSGIKYTGRYRDYRDQKVFIDTWYPSWAKDGTLYSNCADGNIDGWGCNSNAAQSVRWVRQLGQGEPLRESSTTGNASLTGDDPFELKITPLSTTTHKTDKFSGFYPSANLYHNGVWYCGGYNCERWINSKNELITYELGPFGGFRISLDRGQNWTESPFNVDSTLFPERGRCLGEAPIKMGAPHVVDFGCEMEHSPDGMMYLVGHGTADPDGVANWAGGDAVYLARVSPSPETVNDPGAYEFYAGEGNEGPIWSNEFAKIKPIIEWPGHAGCTTITYHPYYKKYFACICVCWKDGDRGCYDNWIAESDSITGPWKQVAYLKGDLGGQGYFVCIPSKFLRPDSDKIVLFYSSNWDANRPGVASWPNPDGAPGCYSLCVAEFELLHR